MPVLLLHGTADPFVPYDRSLRLSARCRPLTLTVHLYDGARHEVLNETNRDEVIGDLVDWVDHFG